MNIKSKLVAAFTAVALLSGCATSGGGFNLDKSDIGTVLGGVGGGLLGSTIGGGSGKTVAIIAGTLIGAWVGREVGASLDRADQAHAQQAFNQASTGPVGNTVRWNNPQSGNSGSFRPVRDGYDTQNNYCREYQTTVTVAGKTEQAYGTACRQPDGSWQLQR